MKEEMDSLLNNKTWDLCNLFVGKRALQNKWVYRLKEEDGDKKIFKVRLVVKGFTHKKGIDFDKVFSPIVKMTSICTALSILDTKDLHLEQLDVKKKIFTVIWMNSYIYIYGSSTGILSQR